MRARSTWPRRARRDRPGMRVAEPGMKKLVMMSGLALLLVGGLQACCSRSGNASGNGYAAAASSPRSEEHTTELQSLMRISSAVFRWHKKKQKLCGAHN